LSRSWVRGLPSRHRTHLTPRTIILRRARRPTLSGPGYTFTWGVNVLYGILYIAYSPRGGAPSPIRQKHFEKFVGGGRPRYQHSLMGLDTQPSRAEEVTPRLRGNHAGFAISLYIPTAELSNPWSIHQHQPLLQLIYFTYIDPIHLSLHKIDSPFFSYTLPTTIHCHSTHYHMPYYIHDKKSRAIAASLRTFNTLHLLSFPNLTPSSTTNNNTTTTQQHHHEWPRYRAFLISSIIHLQHASSIFDLHQLNALLLLISNQPELCRNCITHSNIPNPPDFAFETNFLNTTLLSFQQQLFLPYPPHLFVQLD